MVCNDAPHFGFFQISEFAFSRHPRLVSSASQPAFTERLLRFTGAFLARLIYRVTPHFAERLPAGGFLLLPNHLTWVDAIVLQLACPRPIRFIVFEDIYRQPLLNPIFRAVGALSISPKHAKDTVKAAVALIGQGEIVSKGVSPHMCKTVFDCPPVGTAAPEGSKSSAVE